MARTIFVIRFIPSMDWSNARGISARRKGKSAASRRAASVASSGVLDADLGPELQQLRAGLDQLAALPVPGLADAIDRVSRTFAGFYFGRYDVRAASTARAAAVTCTVQFMGSMVACASKGNAYVALSECLAPLSAPAASPWRSRTSIPGEIA